MDRIQADARRASVPAAVTGRSPSCRTAPPARGRRRRADHHSPAADDGLCRRFACPDLPVAERDGSPPPASLPPDVADAIRSRGPACTRRSSYLLNTYPRPAHPRRSAWRTTILAATPSLTTGQPVSCRRLPGVASNYPAGRGYGDGVHECGASARSRRAATRRLRRIRAPALCGDAGMIPVYGSGSTAVIPDLAHHGGRQRGWQPPGAGRSLVDPRAAGGAVAPSGVLRDEPDVRARSPFTGNSARPTVTIRRRSVGRARPVTQNFGRRRRPRTATSPSGGPGHRSRLAQHTTQRRRQLPQRQRDALSQTGQATVNHGMVQLPQTLRLPRPTLPNRCRRRATISIAGAARRRRRHSGRKRFRPGRQPHAHERGAWATAAGGNATASFLTKTDRADCS